MSADDLPLACFGAGGHGKVVAAQWQSRRGGEPPAFADMQKPCGTRVGSFEVRWSSLHDILGRQVLITIGDNSRRRALQEEAASAGLPFATFVADEHSYFASAPGVGAMILAGAVVNADAVIGDGTIVNTHAIVEHDCHIGAFVHLSPGACVAGGCRIGDGVWIGSNATVIPELVIAEGTVIGAGSTVVRPITEAGIYAGTPARRIR
jgi:sugar O-acyltransferase (sialic acid O-acetyltransferase NeuD family)